MSVMKESLGIFKEGAKVNFDMYGFLTPVFAGVLDGEPRIFGVIFENAQDKEAFARQVQEWIAGNRLKEFIMVAEAWAVKIEEGEQSQVQEWIRQHGSLENWPNRGEMATVIYCSPAEEIEYTADIERGIIPPQLGPWKETHRRVKFDHSQFSTRFQGLFLKGKAGQN